MRRYLVPVALFFVALPAAADAPPDQYEGFDRNSATVVDRKTTLEWDRFRTTLTSFSGYNDYCKNAAFPTNGRLPTIKELLTLFDEEANQEYDKTAPGGRATKHIDVSAFPNTPIDKAYLSQTLDGQGNVYALDFSTGSMVLIPVGAVGRVRCVQ